MRSQQVSRDWKKSIDGKRPPFVEEPGNPIELTDEFVAWARDSDVKIILDQYSEEHHTYTVNRFRENFGVRNVILDNRTSTNNPEERLKLWLKEERATEGYMHDKFLLFSELEGIGKYVIVQMTANINYTQYHQYNNAIILYDNVELFNMYLKHWEDLKYGIKRRSFEGWSIPKPHFMGGRFEQHEVFFFPRKKCPVETMLKELAKQDSLKGTKIDIAMSFLTRTPFPKIFSNLKRAGCELRVIMSEEHQNRNSIDKFKKKHIDYQIIWNKRYNEPDYFDKVAKKKIMPDNWRRRMHHKYILIDHRGQKMVWVGSYNFTHPGLRLNDETVLRINDPGVYDAYKMNFESLWRPGKPKKIIKF
jgi:phosphatidylserine/phosphatidylglycerophosphate/cardiolipin synthase-like enzyme